MHNADWLDSPWEGFFVEGGANLMKPPLTGIEEDNMAHILSKVSSISVADFVPHSGIKRILKGEFVMLFSGFQRFLISLGLPIGWSVDPSVRLSSRRRFGLEL